MGASGKWVKTLIGFKKPQKEHDPEKTGDKKNKKWKLWRSSSGDPITCKSRHHKAEGSDGSDSPCRNDEFNAAMAAVVRAPPKDFRVVKQEWAAIRIQTTFRGFLARRALKAMKGIVRLQALVRGRQVRKQAAMTLRCMQSLVRVQARVRARRVRLSMEGQAVQQLLNERRIKKADPLKQAEEGWCDSKRTLHDVKTKLHMRQEGAFIRERALVYSLAQQYLRSTPNSDTRTNTSTTSTFKNFESWSWLERWMAAKPWENRLMEEANNPSLDIKNPHPKPLPNTLKDISSNSSEHQTSVQVRKNNITTRISAKPPMMSQPTRSSSSLSYDESSASSSTNPVSVTDECRPSYMNLTQSIKAKRSNRMVRQSMDEFQLSKKLYGFTNGDFKSINGFDHSLIGFSRTLNLPIGRVEKNSMRSRGRQNLIV